MKNKIKQKWFKYFIERNIILGLIVSLLMIISIILFLYEITTGTTKTNEKIESYFKIQSNVYELQAAFQDLQLASHSFIETRSKEDSLKYHLSVFKLQNELLTLKSMIESNATLLPRYNQLYESIQNYLSEITKQTKTKLKSNNIQLRVFSLENHYNKILYKHLQALTQGVNQFSIEQYNKIRDDFETKSNYQIPLFISLVLLIAVLMIIIYNDVIRLRQNESEIINQRNELNAIINAVPALIYTGDLDGNIKILNNHLGLNNIGNINIHNHKYREIFYTHEDWLAEEEFDAIIKNKIIIKDIERQFFFNDGSCRWFNSNKAPLIDDKDNVIGIVGVMNDITEKVLSRESLLTVHKQLQQANQQKDKLFSVIAHDLRSPFTGMLGYVEILSDDYDQLNEKEKKNYIDTIKVSLKNLLLLIDSILDWARLNLNRYEYKPEEIDLREIINHVFRSLNIVASNKNISLLSNNVNGSKAFADPDMVEVIIRNLVSNSLKFTNNEGVINVSTIEEEQYIKICIEDNGVGMDNTTINNLFKAKEHRTTLGTNNEKGTGLGLITCKELIEKNYGAITVESKIGVGTKISFTLPIFNNN